MVIQISDKSNFNQSQSWNFTILLQWSKCYNPFSIGIQSVRLNVTFLNIFCSATFTLRPYVKSIENFGRWTGISNSSRNLYVTFKMYIVYVVLWYLSIIPYIRPKDWKGLFLKKLCLILCNQRAIWKNA